MKYTLTQWTASNVEINVTVTADELASHKSTVLKNFQKDMKAPGFRPGHMPLEMVEKQVNPAYLEMGILEEWINASVQLVLREHPEMKFIGQIYDLDKKEGENEVTITYKLDIYPEIKVNNDNWKKNSIPALSSEISDDQLADSFKNLQRQYADYQDVQTIWDSCVAKCRFVTKNADDMEVDSGSLFIGQEEYDEFPALKTLFADKNKGDTVSIDYNESQLPMHLHCKEKDKHPTVVELTINDIKHVTMPEFNDEEIKKFFGDQDDVKTRDQLMTKIKTIMTEQQEQQALAQAIEQLIKDSTSSFDIIVPKTLVDEEIKTRMKSLEEQMWGEEGLKKYLTQIGEEAKTKMDEDIKAAAKESLNKFFVLKAIVDNLWLAVNREQAGDVEKKVYEAMKQ